MAYMAYLLPTITFLFAKYYFIVFPSCLENRENRGKRVSGKSGKFIY